MAVGASSEGKTSLFDFNSNDGAIYVLAMASGAAVKVAPRGIGRWLPARDRAAGTGVGKAAWNGGMVDAGGVVSRQESGEGRAGRSRAGGGVAGWAGERRDA